MRIMRLTRRFAALILVACGIVPGAFPQTDFDFELNRRLTGLEDARAPELFRNQVVIFTYEQEISPRYVAVAFEHDHYSTIHLFSRNANGVYFLVFPVSDLPPNGVLTYRLIVDGLWQPDPENPLVSRTLEGIRLSRVVVELPEEEPALGPVPDQDDLREFTFRLRASDLPTRATPREVALVGSFNNYDPFMDRMREVEDGVFVTRLRLTPGVHFYYYLVGGVAYRDPQGGEAVLLNNRIPATRVTVGQ